MSRTSLALTATGLLLAVVSPVFGQSPVMRSAYHDYRVVTVVEELERPWSIAFLPGGDMLVTERPGRLRIVRDGTLLPDPVVGVPEVLARGQGGLLDVVPHPDFASNRLLYLSYSKPLGDSAGATTAVVRGRFENDRLTDLEEIYEAVSRGNGHYGSRIAFDSNGYVFITTGDRQVPARGDLEAHPAQDISNNHGTINRLHDDGRVPADNPFVDREGARPEIWSYGHRNPQGLAIHPETGDVWATEHGPQGGDELNLIRPGLNYGWPVIGYGVNYRSGSAIHEGTHREGMESPPHFWVPSIATSGLMIYTGDKFPEWRGNLFVGGLAGQQLARLTMDGQSVELEETLVHGLGRIRDVRQGPDGYIYLAIDDRQGGLTPVVRLEPVN
ncbi:MAG: PQQ-dependent sugar dehydrogenase [Gemmatimonadetes bacterium]|nr:PQQ-dependent sugar dehydrogenase [Gemmatimonadota bacterium]